MDEARLIEKLNLIEALFSGAATKGERIAAERARQRILERLELFEREDPAKEFRFSMGDIWSRKVFVALLRRYGIHPYRYRGQRYTTVMANVSKKFVDETLWPEFQELSETLRAYLSEVTDRVVSQVIHQDSSEATVVEKAPQLELVVDNTVDEATSPFTEQGGTVERPDFQADRGRNSNVESSLKKSAKNRARRKKKKKKRK